MFGNADNLNVSVHSISDPGSKDRNNSPLFLHPTTLNTKKNLSILPISVPLVRPYDEDFRRRAVRGEDLRDDGVSGRGSWRGCKGARRFPVTERFPDAAYHHLWPTVCHAIPLHRDPDCRMSCVPKAHAPNVRSRDHSPDQRLRDFAFAIRSARTAEGGTLGTLGTGPPRFCWTDR